MLSGQCCNNSIHSRLSAYGHSLISHQQKATDFKKKSLCLVLLVRFDPWPAKKSNGHDPENVWFVPSKSILYTLKIVHGDGGTAECLDRRMALLFYDSSPVSRWPRRQSLSYLLSQSQCTYHLWRCRSSALKTTPLTVRGIKICVKM